MSNEAKFTTENALCDSAILSRSHGRTLSNNEAAEIMNELFEALEELLFLNSCEEEGISSGQPTPEQWRKAFDKASRARAKATGQQD